MIIYKDFLALILAVCAITDLFNAGPWLLKSHRWGYIACCALAIVSIFYNPRCSGFSDSITTGMWFAVTLFMTIDSLHDKYM